MAEEILALEDCVDHVSLTFDKTYPRKDGRRKTIGNVPDKLHAEVMEAADKHRVHASVFLGGLMDFVDQYEAENKKQLAAQRPKPVKKRK